MRAWLSWTLVVGAATVVALFFGTAADAQAPVRCASLMPADAALIRLPAGVRDADCVLREDFTVVATRYRVADIVGARSRDVETQVAVIREAVERSASVYGRWFHTAPTTIILGSFPGLEEAGEATTDGRGGCVISIENAAHHTGRTLDRADLMRTVAHELFHCVQFTDPTLDHIQLEWRDEATAEYFSGVAVPDAPFNPAYGDTLPLLIERPLYELGESAAPFIFFLGVRRSPEAVANFLQGASRDHSATGSVASLRNIPDVDQLFLDFVHAWIDSNLTDPNGRRVDIAVPDLSSITSVEREQMLELGEARPFQAALGVFQFSRGSTWAIETPDDAQARGTWRRAHESWFPLRASIDACDEYGSGVLVLTSAAASTSPSPRRARATTSPAGERVCRCPVGTWTIGFEDLRRSAFGGMIPEGELISGSVTVSFSPDGMGAGTFNDVTIEAPIDRYSSMRQVLRGGVAWRWRALPWDTRLAGGPPPEGEPSLLLERTVTDVTATWSVQFYARGAQVGERTTPFRSGEAAAGSVQRSPAVCRGPVLSIQPSTITPAPIPPPPWYGTFHRQD